MVSVVNGIPASPNLIQSIDFAAIGGLEETFVAPNTVVRVVLQLLPIVSEVISFHCNKLRYLDGIVVASKAIITIGVPLRTRRIWNRVTIRSLSGACQNWLLDGAH